MARKPILRGEKQLMMIAMASAINVTIAMDMIYTSLHYI